MSWRCSPRWAEELRVAAHAASHHVGGRRYRIPTRAVHLSDDHRAALPALLEHYANPCMHGHRDGTCQPEADRAHCQPLEPILSSKGSTYGRPRSIAESSRAQVRSTWCDGRSTHSARRPPRWPRHLPGRGRVGDRQLSICCYKQAPHQWALLRRSEERGRVCAGASLTPRTPLVTEAFLSQAERVQGPGSAIGEAGGRGAAAAPGPHRAQQCRAARWRRPRSSSRAPCPYPKRR